MPTDLQALLARRREAKAHLDAHNTLLFAIVSICLAVLVLLFASPDFAQAVEWIGKIGF
jgi:hypothetical protein